MAWIRSYSPADRSVLSPFRAEVGCESSDARNKPATAMARKFRARRAPARREGIIRECGTRRPVPGAIVLIFKKAGMHF